MNEVLETLNMKKKNDLCVLRNVSNHAYHSRKSFGILNVFGNNRNQQMNNSKIFDNFKLKIAGIKRTF